MICPTCNRVSAANSRVCAFCGALMDGGTGGLASGAAAGAGAGAAGAAGAAWAAASGRLPGLIERAKNILLSPRTEWAVIEPEPTSAAALYRGYVMPLAGFAALVSFLHLSVLGVGLPFGGTFRTPLLSGLTVAVASFGFGLLGLFLVGLIINTLAPTFAGQRDLRQALKTAAYAFTPAWISSVLSLLGGLGSLLQLAAGCYGIYLLYLGLPVLMKSAREKATGYTVAVVICTLVLGLVFGALSAATGRFGGMGGFSGYGGALSGSAMTEAQRQQQAAAVVGNVLGGMMGADQKGKDGLGAAFNNLADAGQKIEQQQQAAAAQAAAAQPAAADGNAQNAAAAAGAAAGAATAGMLTALGGAMAGSRHVEPVDFHTLKDLLPASLPDLQRSDAQGSSQQAVGVKESEASADYTNASGARARIKIADISGVAGLLDVAQALVQNNSSESDSGFERTSTVGGRMVHEKYDNPSKHGELTVIVAKRFSVEIVGDGLDTATLERDLGSVDLGRLEALKDYGAK